MRVCVFGSSSNHTRDLYFQESVRLGELLAKGGHVCVNGAGATGCMGGVNEGVSRHNGKIKGIIHRRFCVDNLEDSRIKDLIVVDGMDLTERKQQLFAESDGFIVMPGGVGTFDEFWDGVSAKSLDMKNMGHKPIVLMNIDGFYDGFIVQMKRAKADGILYHEVDDYFHVETDVEAALKYCVAHFGQKEEVHHVTDQSHPHLGDDAFQRKNTRSNILEDSNVKISSSTASTVDVKSGLLLAGALAVGILLGYQARK